MENNVVRDLQYGLRTRLERGICCCFSVHFSKFTPFFSCCDTSINGPPLNCPVPNLIKYPKCPAILRDDLTAGSRIFMLFIGREVRRRKTVPEFSSRVPFMRGCKWCCSGVDVLVFSKTVSLFLGSIHLLHFFFQFLPFFSFVVAVAATSILVWVTKHEDGYPSRW